MADIARASGNATFKHMFLGFFFPLDAQAWYSALMHRVEENAPSRGKPCDVNKRSQSLAW